MANEVRDIRILGVYSFEASEDLFRETLEIQWGPNLSGSALEYAHEGVHEHFAGLYLISIAVKPADAEVDWTRITQSIDGQPESNWQVAYDEQLVDHVAGHWAFFMHFLDLGTPLQTQIGDLRLPLPSKLPESLASIQYEVP